MLAGEAGKDLVAKLDIANITLYRWRRQALIDAPGRDRASRVTSPTRSPWRVDALKSSRPNSRR
jgi:hypothetical protein